jgi:hypothetical protein
LLADFWPQASIIEKTTADIATNVFNFTIILFVFAAQWRLSLLS